MAKRSGWRYDQQNARLNFYFDGSVIGYLNANGFTLSSGTVSNGVVQASGLAANLKTGYIPLPLTCFREITSNDIGNVADGAAWGSGGILAKDSTPILERINGATDTQLRISWAATVVDAITAQFAYPPDLDDAAPVEVHLLVCKDANMDATAAIGVAYFEGIGGSNAGGNTAAITETTAAEKSVAITAANVGAAPNVATITLTPGTHANDALYLLAAWVEYTRKS